MHPTLRTSLLLIVLLATGLARASEPAGIDDDASDGLLLRTVELTPERFPAASASLRQQIETGEHASLTTAQKRRIEASLDAIQDELDADRSSAGTRIARHQRRINELLIAPLSTRNARPDMVCRRHKPVGSNILETRCMTREQAEAEREAARSLITGVGPGCDPHTVGKGSCQ
ncbi:MAG: hypothetical protein KF823_03415 [Xanthomonadales bacterium]|nr:hypothetical protein [Xanthomonadales bacterium]